MSRTTPPPLPVAVAGAAAGHRGRYDPWLESTDLLAPLIDPNEHRCGTVRPHGRRELAHPETGFYAIGALRMSPPCRHGPRKGFLRSPPGSCRSAEDAR